MMARFLNDFPSGPLDQYRLKASFDWKKCKVFLESEEILELKHEIYEELKKYPFLYSKDWTTPTIDEQRHIKTRQLFELRKFLSTSKNLKSNDYLRFAIFPLIIAQMNPSLSVKYVVSWFLFHKALETLGSERHANFVKQSLNDEIISCFCLTEVGHGSDTKKMKTTATYDRETKEFVLHSSNFQAAKSWAGNLGKTATHAIVYAQLITPDGVNHSLHAFVVEVRNPKTLLPYPGIIVGDMGEKIGLNGVDNGFIMFHHHRIPRENLLNKTGDVSEDGTYTTTFEDSKRRHNALLSPFLTNRVMICAGSVGSAASAITIAIRYAAVRKQFQSEDGEVPLIEYQSHQCRLFPHLAQLYASKIFSAYLLDICFKFNNDLTSNPTDDELVLLKLEMHVISSAVKALVTWDARDAIQECREACAAHGYLKAAGFGDLKTFTDAGTIIEGDNHVLIQQTSNWLLKLWPLVLEDQPISFPLKSVDFLNHASSILNWKLDVTSLEEFTKTENVLRMFQWLVCYLLKAAFKKQESLVQQKGLSLFWAKSESQVYFCKNLAFAYIQHFMVQRMCITVSQSDDPHIKDVLTKLVLLYSMASLEKHTATFYIGRYASGPTFAGLIREAILKLCRSLKNDALALVDSIAPPDFMLDSVLGQSDGQVYKHLERAIVFAPGALERPKWWKEVSFCLTENNLASNL